MRQKTTSDKSLSEIEQFENILLNINLDFAPDIEKQVIGMMMKFPEINFSEITPELFYNPRYRRLFIIIRKLKEINVPVNVQSICDEYKQEYKWEIHKSSIIEIYNHAYYYKYHEYLGRILIYNYAKRTYLQTIGLLPRFIFGDMRLEDFLESFKELSEPLMKMIQKQEETNKIAETIAHDIAKREFVPHYVAKGNERYKVLMSKFEPYYGYCWVNDKAVKETKLLEDGFEQIYE